MSDATSDRSYSAFWPLAILLATLLLSDLYQLVELIGHRSYIDNQYEQAQTNLPKAQQVHDRLVMLVKDLIATGQKDPNAIGIVRQAQQAGILRERPANTNAAPTNPAPTGP